MPLFFVNIRIFYKKIRLDSIKAKMKYKIKKGGNYCLLNQQNQTSKDIFFDKENQPKTQSNGIYITAWVKNGPLAGYARRKEQDEYLM